MRAVGCPGVHKDLRERCIGVHRSWDPQAFGVCREWGARCIGYVGTGVHREQSACFFGVHRAEGCTGTELENWGCTGPQEHTGPRGAQVGRFLGCPLLN